MNASHVRLVLSLALLALGPPAALGQEPAEATEEPAGPEQTSSIDAFAYDEARLQVGRVYHYRKSNIDGTHESRIALHVAAADRIEALKWTPGLPDATLVVAEMDWTTFSVRGFRTYRIDEAGERQLIAELEASQNGRRLDVRARGESFGCDVEHLPWHSYDFDFASLNVGLRFLVVPESSVVLGIADVRRSSAGIEFAFKGRVELSYLTDETRHGQRCRVYTIDGPGLEDRGGTVWVSRDAERCIVDLEIDLPDEAGMVSGKLLLMDREVLDADAWEAFVRLPR